MKPVNILSCLCMLAFVVSTLFMSTAAGHAEPWVPCGTWSNVISPNPASTYDVLYSVSAVSARSVWAVGVSINFTDHTSKTLVEHWDGKAWSIIPSADILGQPDSLSGVAAINDQNVWAVGSFSYTPPVRGSETMIEHWDGKAWRIVPSPGPTSSVWRGVTALSSQNIWAVGSVFQWDTNTSQTLSGHSDGTSWGLTRSPNPGSKINALSGVAAASGGDVWAVGYSNNLDDSVIRSLIEHWDGTQWSVVNSPNRDPADTLLSGVAALSSRSAWAVGAGLGALIEHWNGTKWSIVKSPTTGASLRGVAALSEQDVWAVGDSFDPKKRANQTLIEHWDGSQWSIVKSPNRDDTTIRSSNNSLFGVTRVPHTKGIWGVGSYDTSTNPPLHQTLTQFYCP